VPDLTREDGREMQPVVRSVVPWLRLLFPPHSQAKRPSVASRPIKPGLSRHDGCALYYPPMERDLPPAARNRMNLQVRVIPGTPRMRRSGSSGRMQHRALMRTVGKQCEGEER
jgi:hypothetical protein